jgi:hypothetical protein
MWDTGRALGLAAGCAVAGAAVAYSGMHGWWGADAGALLALVALGVAASRGFSLPESGALRFFCKYHADRGMDGQLLAGEATPQPVASGAGGEPS